MGALFFHKKRSSANARPSLYPSKSSPPSRQSEVGKSGGADTFVSRSESLQRKDVSNLGGKLIR